MVHVEHVILRFDIEDMVPRKFRAIDRILCRFPRIQTVTLEVTSGSVNTSLVSKLPLLRDSQRLRFRTWNDSCAVSLAAKRCPDDIRDGYAISTIWSDDTLRRKW